MLLASDLSSVVTVRTPYEIWRLPTLSGLDDGPNGRAGVGEYRGGRAAGRVGCLCVLSACWYVIQTLN